MKDCSVGNLSGPMAPKRTIVPEFNPPYFSSFFVLDLGSSIYVLHVGFRELWNWYKDILWKGNWRFCVPIKKDKA